MEKKPSGRETHQLSSEEHQQVLDAALSLFSEDRPQGSLLEKISDRCSIPASRIQQHFGRPQDLIEALLERELQLIAGSVPVPELRFPGETLQDELGVLSRILIDEYRTNLSFLRILLTEAIRNPDFGAVFYKTFIVRGRKLFTEFLSARQERGELRPEVNVEAAAAFFLSALTFSLLLLEMMGGKSVEKVADDWIVETLSDLFLRGVLAN